MADPGCAKVLAKTTAQNCTRAVMVDQRGRVRRPLHNFLGEKMSNIDSARSPIDRLLGRPSTRQRLLAAADRLFYEEGIRATTLERIIAEAGVGKGAFYKNYRSKDALVVDYVDSRHANDVSTLNAMYEAGMPAREMLLAVLDEIVVDLNRPSFRGCAFINAAAEYIDPQSDVRLAIRNHREWLITETTRLLKNAGHPLPGDRADDLLIVRDGGMSSGHSGDPVSAAAAMQRAINRAVDELRA